MIFQSSIIILWYFLLLCLYDPVIGNIIKGIRISPISVSLPPLVNIGTAIRTTGIKANQILNLVLKLKGKTI